MPLAPEILPGGLTLLMLPRPQAATVACGFFVRTGAADEDPALMGVSHFLEHMMFKGSATRSAADINNAFDAMGADANAWTSHETTTYHAHLLPEFLPRALDLLADMLRPALREADFESERQVILEEIGMYDDRPEWRLSDVLLERHHRGHGHGHRVLGTRETVGRMTPAEMRRWFDARYAPDTMALSVCGNFDPAAVRAQAAALTAAWPRCGLPRRALPAHATGGGEAALADARCARRYWGGLAPAPAAQERERFAARVLATVLGDDDGSRLYRGLTEPGIAEDADFGYAPQDGQGTFSAFIGCDPGHAAEAEEVLRRTVDDLASGRKPVDQDELLRAVNKLATRAAIKDERPNGCMQSFGVQWAIGDTVLLPEEEAAALRAVTRDQVQDLAVRCLAGGFTTQVRLGP